MNWLTNIFKQKKSPYPILISFLTLRRLIGILGICLPAILLLGTFIIGGCSQVQESISHYYYTGMRDVFVGIICAIAVFLISYKGYEPKDNIATTLAGIFALLIAFFPTTQNQDPECTIYYMDHCILRIYTHYISAFLLFSTLAYISYFLFTRGAEQKNKQKLFRNKVYKTCGIILMSAVIFISIIRLTPAFEIAVYQYNIVFWLEWIGLAAFGVSWLIKGKVLFKDYVSNN